MSMNLPPGFTPELWVGWKGVGTCQIYRFLKHRGRRPVTVMFLDGCFFTMAGAKGHRDLRKSSGRATEAEALAWCEKYAEQHGGWADPAGEKAGEGEVEK